MQERRLCIVIQIAQGLGKCRMRELQRLQDLQGLDFAAAIQQVLSAAEPAPVVSHQVTVEEVERSLNHVASACEFSSSSIRGRLLPRHGDAAAELRRVFRRVENIQAK